MLKPRRLNRPAMRASTPGLFSVVIERTCLRPGQAAGGGLQVLELDQVGGAGFHGAAFPALSPTMSRAAAPAGIIG